MELSQWLLILSSLSGFIPVGVAFFRYHQYDSLLRTVAVFLLISLGFDFSLALYAMAVYSVHGNPNNLPLVHLFAGLMSGFLGRIYEMALVDSTRVRKGIRIGTGLLIAYALVNTIPSAHTDGLLNYPSRALTAQSLFFLMLALFYFYRVFTAEQPVVHLERTGMFWVNSAVLIYFSVNLFAFMLYESMIEQGGAELNNLIHLSSNLIMNLFYALGLFCKISQPKT